MQNYFKTKKNHTVRITAHDWYSKDVSYIGQYDGRKLPLSSGGACPFPISDYIPKSEVEANYLPKSIVATDYILTSIVETDYFPRSEVEQNYITRDEVEESYFPVSCLEEIREEISTEICTIITSTIGPLPPPDPATTYYKVSVIPQLTGSDIVYTPMKTSWCLSGTTIDYSNSSVFLPSQQELISLNPAWQFLRFDHDFSTEAVVVDKNTEVLAIYEIKQEYDKDYITTQNEIQIQKPVGLGTVVKEKSSPLSTLYVDSKYPDDVVENDAEAYESENFAEFLQHSVPFYEEGSNWGLGLESCLDENGILTREGYENYITHYSSESFAKSVHILDYAIVVCHFSEDDSTTDQVLTCCYKTAEKMPDAGYVGDSENVKGVWEIESLGKTINSEGYFVWEGQTSQETRIQTIEQGSHSIQMTVPVFHARVKAAYQNTVTINLYSHTIGDEYLLSSIILPINETGFASLSASDFMQFKGPTSYADIDYPEGIENIGFSYSDDLGKHVYYFTDPFWTFNTSLDLEREYNN